MLPVQVNFLSQSLSQFRCIISFLLRLLGVTCWIGFFRARLCQTLMFNSQLCCLDSRGSALHTGMSAAWDKHTYIHTCINIQCTSWSRFKYRTRCTVTGFMCYYGQYPNKSAASLSPSRLFQLVQNAAIFSFSSLHHTSALHRFIKAQIMGTETDTKGRNTINATPGRKCNFWRIPGSHCP